MEEKNKTKETKMGNGDSESQQKYTYEQLNEICSKLLSENQYLRQRHQEDMEAINTINRLNYLLKIVEIENKASQWHFNQDFITMCMSEIEKIMTPPTEDEKEDTKEN